MRYATLKKKYPNSWLLLEVRATDRRGRPLEVAILAKGKSREEVYDALLRAPKNKRLATLFTGRVLQEGYAAAFTIIV